MFRIQRKFVESCLLIMLLITLFLLASLSATARQLTNSQVVYDGVARKTNELVAVHVQSLGSWLTHLQAY